MKLVKSIFLITACSIITTGCSTLFPRKDTAWQKFIDNSIVVKNAKRAYQMGHNVPDNTEATWEDLKSCLPSQWRPVCLEGGYIQPGRIGKPMKCSIHGQVENPRHIHSDLN